ncbi:MAG: hypothetical protein NTV34_07865, partial [Proteobacteria bacterium]|nr:hypothetical protein [Pseudomonadota bacterium]
MTAISSHLKQKTIPIRIAAALVFQAFGILILAFQGPQMLAAEVNYSLGKNGTNAENLAKAENLGEIPRSQDGKEKNESDLFENAGPAPLNTDDPSSYQEPKPITKSNANLKATKPESRQMEQNQLTPIASAPKVSRSQISPFTPIAQRPINQPSAAQTWPATSEVEQRTEQRS